MVARQNTKAARSDRQRFMKPKFGRKISDRIFEERRRMLVRPGILIPEILLERPKDTPDALRELRVLQTDPQFVIRNLVKNRDGIMIKILPAARRKFLEDSRRFYLKAAQA